MIKLQFNVNIIRKFPHLLDCLKHKKHYSYSKNVKINTTWRSITRIGYNVAI